MDDKEIRQFVTDRYLESIRRDEQLRKRQHQEYLRKKASLKEFDKWLNILLILGALMITFGILLAIYGHSS